MKRYFGIVTEESRYSPEAQRNVVESLKPDVGIEPGTDRRSVNLLWSKPLCLLTVEKRKTDPCRL